MKTATYRRMDGSALKVEYDEHAPCEICGESVTEASMGGTTICPWCDCGHCRYCGVDLPMGKEAIRVHMKRHKGASDRKEE